MSPQDIEIAKAAFAVVIFVSFFLWMGKRFQNKSKCCGADVLLRGHTKYSYVCMNCGEKCELI